MIDQLAGSGRFVASRDRTAKNPENGPLASGKNLAQCEWRRHRSMVTQQQLEG